MSQSNCRENFLEDVVSVFVYKSADCVIAEPPTIPIKSVAFVAPSQGPLVQFHIAQNDGDVVMSDVPTLKITNNRTSAGNIYSHELQITTSFNRAGAEDAVGELQKYDFIILYQTTDGSHYISYSLPNTSVADIEESISSNSSVNIKLKLQSMSPLIDIV